MKNKNLLITLFLSVFYTFSLSAQNMFEKDIAMSKGIQNALVIELDGADKKTAEKVWKDMAKNYGKTKKEKDEYRNELITVPALSSQTVSMYMKLEDLKDMTRAYVWVDTGEHFINSIEHSEQSEVLEDMLKAYYREVRKKVVGKEVEQEEDVLKDLNKDLEKLEKKNEDYHKEIEKAKKKIAEMESNIEKNLEDQENKKVEISDQETNLAKVIEKLNAIGKGM